MGHVIASACIADEIRDWYNGYSWRGEEKVYNPFDILLLFRRQSFEAYWFETVLAWRVQTQGSTRVVAH